MSLRDLSLRVAVLTALQKRVKDALDTARGELQRHMLDVGADTVSASIGDVKVAKIPLAVREAKAHVADEKALLEWVRERNPAEIVTVETVRPSYLDVLLANAIDPVTGELPDGVEIGEPSRYLQVRGLDTDVIGDAWRNGELSPLQYLELEQ